MNHSPLKTALAYECFQEQDNSTLALPSDQKMKTGTSGRQRVQEQVLMTVRRQKSKSSQSSTLSHSNRGKGCARARAHARGLRRVRAGSVRPCPAAGRAGPRFWERGGAGEAGLRRTKPERPALSRPGRRAPVSAQAAGSPGRGCRRARLAPGPRQGWEGARGARQPASGKRPPGRRAPWGRPLSHGLPLRAQLRWE